MPSFAKKAKRKGRNMISLSDIDVARDILDIDFISRNDDEGSSKEFFLEMTDWGPRGIDIFVNFTDPLSVSQGEGGDTMACTIKNPSMFVPEGGGEPLSADKAMVVSEVPKQLPKGVSAEKLKEQADSAASAMKTLAIVQLVASAFLKGVIKDLIGMFFTL